MPYVNITSNERHRFACDFRKSQNPAISESDLARFRAKVRRGRPTECWLWTAGTIGRRGWEYGQFTRDNGPGKSRLVYAHRFAWEVAFGPIPEGQVVCHSCDVTRCCNPSHLFLGSQGDNIRDASSKGHLTVARKRNWRIKPLVIDRYLSGDVTAKELGAEYGISFMTVHRWIREATNGQDQRARRKRAA